MSNVVIVTGDDVLIPNTIIKDKVQVTIPITAIVTCRLVSIDQSKVYSSAVNQVSTEEGADWENGLVMCRFNSVVTLEILDDTSIDWKNGALPALVETKINDNGRLTWYESVHITRGSLD